MSYEERDMSGVLFEETNKRSDASPEWSGQILINGRKYRIAGWDKTGQTGRKRISIKVSEMERR